LVRRGHRHPDAEARDLPAGSRGLHRAAAASGLPRRDPARYRRRPAAQSRQVRHRRVVSPSLDPDLPIGVFDSGVGGLTVLRAIREALPAESTLYLGDTARVPYGTKSADSVLRYSLQASDLLVRRGIKLLVVACNTASALSLD